MSSPVMSVARVGSYARLVTCGIIVAIISERLFFVVLLLLLELLLLLAAAACLVEILLFPLSAAAAEGEARFLTGAADVGGGSSIGIAAPLRSASREPAG